MCSIHVYALPPAEEGRALAGPTLLAVYELPCNSANCSFSASSFSAGYGRKFEPVGALFLVKGVNIYVRDSIFLSESLGHRVGKLPRFVPWGEWGGYAMDAAELDLCGFIRHFKASCGFRAVHGGFVLDFNQYDIAHNLYGDPSVNDCHVARTAYGPSAVCLAMEAKLTWLLCQALRTDILHARHTLPTGISQAGQCSV